MHRIRADLWWNEWSLCLLRSNTLGDETRLRNRAPKVVERDQWRMSAGLVQDNRRRHNRSLLVRSIHSRASGHCSIDTWNHRWALLLLLTWPLLTWKLRYDRPIVICFI